MAKFDTGTKESLSHLIEQETSHSYWCPTGQKCKVWKLPGEANKSLICQVHEMKCTVIIATDYHVFNCSDYRHSLSISEENLYIMPQEQFCSVACRGSPLTTAQLFPRLQMEKTASKSGASLRIYRLSSRGQPTRCGPSAWIWTSGSFVTVKT